MKTFHFPFLKKSAPAFTLVELLLSIGIFAIVLVAMGEMVNAVLHQMRIAEARFSQFQEAQAAFDSMTRRLSTCEINPYYDYQYPSGSTSDIPTKYDLESDLHFVSGPASAGAKPLLTGIPGGSFVSHSVFFHGTYGITDNTALNELNGLMNSWGYFIEFGDDDAERAEFLNQGHAPTRYRFRLKELQVPAETLLTYTAQLNKQTNANGLYNWFRNPITNKKAHTLAENVVALIISPLLATPNSAIDEKDTDLAPNYFYDSRAYQHSAASTNLMQRTRHQLPPLLRVTLVALDDASAQRLADKNGGNLPDLYPASLFTDATKYEQDLATLEENLTDQNLQYRIFSTTIRLRNSKWTSNF